jgi:hypothetical protein
VGLNFIIAGLGGLLFLLTCAAASADGTYRVLKLEGNAVRWQHAAQDQPQLITYRVIDSEVAFPRARNCRGMTSPTQLLVASEITETTMRQEIVAAFAMWEEVANLTFREAAPAERADILIGAQLETEGWAFADVFYDANASSTVKPISQALICLNPWKRWKVGFDGDLKTYDLRYTLAHEIGHAIGLDHPAGAGQIMGYRYEERFRSLQPGDIAGAIQLYGERPSDGTLVASDPSRPDAERSIAAGRSTGGRALNPRAP